MLPCLFRLPQQAYDLPPLLARNGQFPPRPPACLALRSHTLYDSFSHVLLHESPSDPEEAAVIRPVQPAMSALAAPSAAADPLATNDPGQRLR